MLTPSSHACAPCQEPSIRHQAISNPHIDQPYGNPVVAGPKTAIQVAGRHTNCNADIYVSEWYEVGEPSAKLLSLPSRRGVCRAMRLASCSSSPNQPLRALVSEHWCTSCSKRTPDHSYILDLLEWRHCCIPTSARRPMTCVGPVISSHKTCTPQCSR